MSGRHIAAFALALAAKAGAQQAPERAGYYLISGTDTIIAERAVRSATELSGEVLDRVKGSRLSYVAALSPDGLITRLETRVFAAGGDTIGRRGSLTFDGDSIVADLGSGTVHIPSASRALMIISASAPFMEQVLLRARGIANGQTQVSFPVFVTSIGQTAPVMVTFIGADSASITLGNVQLRVAMSPDGRLLGATAPAQRMTIVRGTDVKLVAANYYGAPRGAPYFSEDIELRTPAGLRLTGTLTIPRGRPTGRAPAVVTISGAGSEDRDEGSSALPGYRPFYELADTLGRRGIAVLRLDDRGVNGSDAGERNATVDDLAADIRAAVAYLRARPEIDGARVGLVGHREGALIAPMVTSTDSALRALVLMAASASTGRELVLAQNRYMIDSVLRLQGAARDVAFERARRGIDSVGRVRASERSFYDYDPSVAARDVKIPALILHGETDKQVSPAEATKLAAAFRSGGNARVEMRTFPETNHLFVADAHGAFRDVSGAPRYASLPSLRVRREVLGAVADWLSAQLK